MTLLQMTVEIEAESTQVARLLASAAGFTVKRVSQSRTSQPTTPQSPFVRASAVLDRPAGLDPDERRAYSRGYAAACLTFVKKVGIPQGEGLPALHKATRQAEWDRHPAAHKKGMAELAAYQERTAVYLAARSARLAVAA